MPSFALERKLCNQLQVSRSQPTSRLQHLHPQKYNYLFGIYAAPFKLTVDTNLPNKAIKLREPSKLQHEERAEACLLSIYVRETSLT